MFLPGKEKATAKGSLWVSPWHVPTDIGGKAHIEEQKDPRKRCIPGQDMN